MALLEGRLPVAANALAHGHAADCASCRTLLVALAHSDALPAEACAAESVPVEHGRFPVWAATVPGATWKPPVQLDEFRLERLLGRGGMGAVYLARDTLVDRRVALKLCVALQPDAGTLASFAMEAHAIARIKHPNVVTMYRAGEIDGRPYLVYEHVEGKSLAELRPPLPWQRVLDIAVGLSRGLRAAHERGVLHRDLKPGNAILTPDGAVKLLDFGLATFVGSGRSPLLAVPGVVGTPRYMAPETRLGASATPQSDFYALGLMLFELCTGRASFMRHASPSAFRLEGGAGMRARVSELVPGIDPGFAAAIGCCLAEDPAERFAQADALCAVLEHVARSGLHPVASSQLFPSQSALLPGLGLPPPEGGSPREVAQAGMGL
ncbi:serine/threonine-protein kinase [Corallococcus sicarius]|uniref:Serine/threonine protein kinase n=1 Tax=Corallococcus sicarius TaxID=2316726 RepID=A0A3A8N2I4_9BACT|nr:serine/threonine-protein kinase [Corallococcus sicarius]RKH38233.1 serine/threonine protein kinase [Corallococcus sicarius]